MKTLLLDWSGTLVDDFTPTVYATNEVFKRYGLPLWSPEEFREKFYLPYPKFYEEILPEVPLAELEVIFREAFVNCPTPVTPLAPTLEFLDWAQSVGLQLIILSSMDTQNLVSQAKEFGVHDHFQAIYAGVLNKCETISEIMERHELNPKTTAFVGDMVHDLHAAHEGGVLSVAVLSGYDPASRLIPEAPALILNNVGKLRPLIESFYLSSEA